MNDGAKSRSQHSEKPPRLWTPNYIWACSANLLLGLAFYLMIPVLPLYLTDDLKAPGGWLGIIMSSYVLAAILMRPIVAHWVDHGDRKKAYILIYLFLVITFCGYGIAGTAVTMLLARIMNGFAWGGVTTSGPTLVADIIPSARRGEGLGFYGMTMTLGMCLGPVIGLNIYTNYSFPAIIWCTIGLGFLGWLCSLMIKAPAKPVNEPVVETPKGVLDRLILRVGIPLAINVVMASFSYGIVAVYSAMYGQQYGFQYAGLFYALMGVGMLMSRFIVGKQIDRGRVAELSVASLSILSVSFGALACFPLEPIYYGAAVFIGMGFGIFIPTFQTMKLNMASRGHRGAVNSTFFTAFDIGAGAGMLMGGKIYAWLNLNWAFGVGAIFNVLAIIYFYRVSLDHYRKNKLGVDS